MLNKRNITSWLLPLSTDTNRSFHLNKVIQDSFVGHVTIEAVIPLQEVWSEMMQERVQVQRIITLPPAVNTLTALKNTHTRTQSCVSTPPGVRVLELSFCKCSGLRAKWKSWYRNRLFPSCSGMCECTSKLFFNWRECWIVAVVWLAPNVLWVEQSTRCGEHYGYVSVVVGTERVDRGREMVRRGIGNTVAECVGSI